MKLGEIACLGKQYNNFHVVAVTLPSQFRKYKKFVIFYGKLFFYLTVYYPPAYIHSTRTTNSGYPRSNRYHKQGK